MYVGALTLYKASAVRSEQPRLRILQQACCQNPARMLPKPCRRAAAVEMVVRGERELDTTRNVRYIAKNGSRATAGALPLYEEIVMLGDQELDMPRYA